MEKSLYPEGVEIRHTDLQNTETTKADQIKQRHLDSDEMGITNGGSITVNLLNDVLIDVEATDGYVDNGEYINLSAQIGIALADYTLNSINIIAAVYTETHDTSRPHETSTLPQATRANPSVRFRIFTEAEYNGLVESDDDLSNDARDRTLVIGKVTANGPGISLSNANITTSISYGSAIQVTNTTDTITGVTIRRIDPTTSEGSGELAYLGGDAFRWKGPGESSFGSSVLAAQNGIIQLNSVAGYWIEIYVILNNLPIGATTDTLSVENIYSREIYKRFSVVDIHHRSQLGSGVPDDNNPHGLTPEDIGFPTDAVTVHQDTHHSDAVMRYSDDDTLLTVVNTGTSPDHLMITSPATGDEYFIAGLKHTGVSPTTMVFTDILDNYQSLWDLYVYKDSTLAGDGSLEKYRRAYWVNIPGINGGPNVLADVLQLTDVDPRIPSGTTITVYKTTENTLYMLISGESTVGAIEVDIPTIDVGFIRLYNNINTTGSLAGVWLEFYSLTDITFPAGNINEDIIIENQLDQDDRFKIATVKYSGQISGYLGNGFGAGHSPNIVKDQREFGSIGSDDLLSSVQFTFTHTNNDSLRYPANSLNSLGQLNQTRKAILLEDKSLGVGSIRPNARLHVETVDEAVAIFGRTRIGQGLGGIHEANVVTLYGEFDGLQEGDAVTFDINMEGDRLNNNREDAARGRFLFEAVNTDITSEPDSVIMRWQARDDQGGTMKHILTCDPGGQIGGMHSGNVRILRVDMVQYEEFTVPRTMVIRDTSDLGGEGSLDSYWAFGTVNSISTVPILVSTHSPVLTSGGQIKYYSDSGLPSNMFIGCVYDDGAGSGPAIINFTTGSIGGGQEVRSRVYDDIGLAPPSTNDGQIGSEGLHVWDKIVTRRVKCVGYDAPAEVMVPASLSDLAARHGNNCIIAQVVIDINAIGVGVPFDPAWLLSGDRSFNILSVTCPTATGNYVVTLDYPVASMYCCEAHVGILNHGGTFNPSTYLYSAYVTQIGFGSWEFEIYRMSTTVAPALTDDPNIIFTVIGSPYAV